MYDAKLLFLIASLIASLALGAQSFESLARQSALENDAVNMLRLLNRLYPTGDINTTGQIKTVSLED